MPTGSEEKTDPQEVAGASNKDVLRLVAQKLESQALLFSLGIALVLVGAWATFRDWRILLAVLFIFLVGLAAYLFVEQKNKVERGEPKTVARLLANRMEELHGSAASFVQVWTAPATGAQSGQRDIGIVPTGPGASYHVGESIVMFLRTTKDCYVTLLNVGTSGKLTIVFPNQHHRDNFLQANQVYRIPGEDDSFTYQLMGPAGVEKLKAIATLEKVDLVESQFAPDGSLFRVTSAREATRDIGIIQQSVKTLPAQEWAAASSEFRVEG